MPAIALRATEFCTWTGPFSGLPFVRDVAIELRAGEIAVVLGLNGSGKTSLLRGLAGLTPSRGQVEIGDGAAMTDISAATAQERARAGLVYIFGVLPGHSVWQNLSLAAQVSGRWATEDAWLLFQALMGCLHLAQTTVTRRQLAGTLSGGERRVLILTMSLVASPRVLLVDEPSSGLSPSLTDAILDVVLPSAAAGAVAELLGPAASGCRSNDSTRQSPVAILLAEQNPAALRVADRAFAMQAGRLSEVGPKDLLSRYTSGRLPL